MVFVLVAVNLFTTYISRGAVQDSASLVAVSGIRERMDDTEWFFRSMAKAISTVLRDTKD